MESTNWPCAFAPLSRFYSFSPYVYTYRPLSTFMLVHIFTSSALSSRRFLTCPHSSLSTCMSPSVPRLFGHSFLGLFPTYPTTKNPKLLHPFVPKSRNKCTTQPKYPNYQNITKKIEATVIYHAPKGAPKSASELNSSTYSRTKYFPLENYATKKILNMVTPRHSDIPLYNDNMERWAPTNLSFSSLEAPIKEIF